MYGSCTMEKSVPPPARPTAVPLVPAQPAAAAAPELPFNPSLLRTSAPVALTTQGKGGNTEAVKGRCLGDGLFPRGAASFGVVSSARLFQCDPSKVCGTAWDAA